MKLMLAILVLAALTGCARFTDAQAVQLAQAKANVTAARVTTDAAARSALYAAAGARLMAGLSDLDLPPAPHPPGALVEPSGNPIVPAIAQEVAEAQAAENNPPGGIWAAAAGIAGGVGLLALSVLRFSPGAFGALASLAHTVLAPKATREMRAAEMQGVAIAEQAIAYGHSVTEIAVAAGLKPTIEAIKGDFGRAQDQLGLRPQIDTLLQAYKDGKLAIKPT